MKRIWRKYVEDKIEGKVEDQLQSQSLVQDQWLEKFNMEIEEGWAPSYMKFLFSMWLSTMYLRLTIVIKWQ